MIDNYQVSGWESATLAQVLTPLANGKRIQQGWSPQCHKDASPDNSTWGVLKTTAIQFGEFLEEHNKRLPADLTPDPSIEVHPGDLLLTCAGPRARCAVPTLVRSTRPRLMLSGKMYRFRVDESVMDPRFLEFFLMSPGVQRPLDRMKTGISDSGLNLTQSRFSNLPVVIPPLPEQLRIVDLLEDHLSRLDAGSSLLEVIAARLQTLRARQRADLAGDDVRTRSLGQLSLSSGYGTSAKCAVDGPGVPVVRIPNLRAGKIDLTEEKRVVDPAVDLSNLMLEQGDLLIVRTNGSRDLIGRAAVVQSGLKSSFASYLIRFKIDTSVVRPEWVRILLDTPKVRTEIVRLAASSAGQYNLGLKKLQTLEIACPSLEDQDRLLARYADAEWQTEALMAAVRAATARNGTLRRALLTTAFEGKLAGRPEAWHAVEEMAGV